MKRFAFQDKPDQLAGPFPDRIDWLLTELAGDIFESTQNSFYFAHRSNPNVATYSGEFVRMDDAFLLFESGFISTGNSPFTVMVRFRMPVGFGGFGYGVLFGFGNDAPNEGFVFSANTGATGFRFNFGSGVGNVQGGTVNAGVWYTACARYDGSTAQLWVDGVLIGTTAYSAANTNANNFLGNALASIGAFYSSGGPAHSAYEGDTRDIAWARYYKRAVDTSELLMVMDSPFMDFTQKNIPALTSLVTTVNRRTLGSRVGSRTIHFS